VRFPSRLTGVKTSLHDKLFAGIVSLEALCWVISLADGWRFKFYAGLKCVEKNVTK
jgi:hypothetical protein